MLLFFVLPFGAVVYYSLIRSPMNREFVFLDNFRALFQNAAFRMAAKNTALFSALAVPLAVALALVLALLLEARLPLNSQFRTFFLSPMMVPVASVVLIWQVVFSGNGVLNEILSGLGATPVDWLKSDAAPLVVVALFLWKNLGYNMILVRSALAQIPKELLEAAEVEGAPPLYQLFAIK
ncbi:MAG: sugar ABC transporter permease, partial [Oscillospiraceae bacterium]|nr:sugar ABC transporter permease [Oscillospiraceae bacterium]